jgi:hypothetical protein
MHDISHNCPLHDAGNIPGSKRLKVCFDPVANLLLDVNLKPALIPVDTM